MKLRNKRTGDIWEFDCIGLSIAETTLRKLKAGQAGGVCFANSLADLNDEWEDVPAEPLIKDEKIRKAVRAWADVNEIDEVEYSRLRERSEFADAHTSIVFYGEITYLDEDKDYTIAELCGEEDE